MAKVEPTTAVRSGDSLVSLRQISLPRRVVLAVALVAVAAAAAISVVIATAGGSSQQLGEPVPFNPGGTFYPSIDWSHPGGRDGRLFTSVAGAAKKLAFEPVVPTNLGAPTAIAVDPHSGGNSQLDVVYGNSASSGVYWLVERPTTQDTTSQTFAEYAHVAAKVCKSPGSCKATWTMVPLDGGNRGLLVQGPAGTTTSVDWAENAIYFSVIGPADSFYADQAKSAANSVIATAAAGA